MIIIGEKEMIRLRDMANKLYDATPRPDVFKIHLEALRMLLLQSGEVPSFDLEENQRKFKP